MNARTAGVRSCLARLLIRAAAATLVVQATPSLAAAQALPDTLEVVENLVVPGSAKVKFPKVVVSGGQVWLAGSAEEREARLWSKPVGGATFAPPQALGRAAGKPDYSTSDLYATLDGALYFVWIDQAAEHLWLRRKPAGQGWEPERLVADSAFRVNAQVAVTSNGRIFVVWNGDYRFRFRTSVDGGLTWSTTQLLSNVTPLNHAILAVSGADVWVAYGSNAGEIFLASWNGSSFSSEKLSLPQKPGQFFADPTVAVGSRRQIAVAYRDTKDGIFLRERAPGAAWGAVQTVGRGSAMRWVSLSFDALDHLHMAWLNDATKALIYQLRKPEGVWLAPLTVPNAGKFTSGVRGVAFLGQRTNFALAFEEHNPLVTRYMRIVGPSALRWRATTQVLCANGAAPAQPQPAAVFHAYWPPQPLVWSEDTFGTGPHTVDLRVPAKISNVYVGMELQDGTVLRPLGFPPHEAIVYATFFNPPTWMARWQALAVPPGGVSLAFEAPQGWCP